MKTLTKLTTITASEAKNRFGKLLDWARRAPVVIEKQGREVAVMLSIEEYNRLVSINQEVLRDEAGENELSIQERLKILKLPLEKRNQILRENAEKILSHYQENRELGDLSGGDFIEY